MSAKSLCLAVVASLSLVSAVAIADTTNPPVPGGSPIPTPTQPTTPGRDDVELRCRFEGGGTGKDGSWYEKCRAEAKIDVSRHDEFRWIFGDGDDFLRVRCDDGDHDGDDNHHDKDERVLYGQTPNFAMGEDRVDTLITGDKTISPLIRLSGLDLRDLANNHDRRMRDRVASLTFTNRFGMTFLIPGVCEFRRSTVIIPVP